MVTLNIKENDAQHALVLLKGELDTAATEKFTNDLSPLTEDAGKKICIDFGELKYISSAGMRILLALNRQALARGGKVSIKGMSQDIHQIFQMTGFDQMFEIIEQ